MTHVAPHQTTPQCNIKETLRLFREKMKKVYNPSRDITNNI